jgi:hypothetical protein
LIISVRSAGTREGRAINETRYDVTSLRTTAKALLRHVRDRWSIENSWHRVRDTQPREDAHRYRERNGGPALAELRTVALNLLRLNGFDSIAEEMGTVSHNVERLVRLMRCQGKEGPQPPSSWKF